MRPTPNLAVERYRIRNGQWGSTREAGNNGAFQVPCCGRVARVIISDGLGWDHVSVSFPDRCPTWEEMSAIKDMFFEPEECVVQYHPPHSSYKNLHQYCLHLWRPRDADIPMPLPEMVA